MGKLEAEGIVNRQRSFFHTGKTLEPAFRKEQLTSWKDMLKVYEQEIYHALRNDLNKSEYEACTTESGFSYSECDFALKHLKDWVRLKKVEAPLTYKGSKRNI